MKWLKNLKISLKKVGIPRQNWDFQTIDSIYFRFNCLIRNIGIKKYKITDLICKVIDQNWTNVRISLLSSIENIIASKYAPTAAHYNGQLLHFGIGCSRWITFTALSHHVGAQKWEFRWLQFQNFDLLASIIFYRFPYKQIPPLGYLLCWLFQTELAFCAGFSVVSTLCLMVGSCWLIMAFVKDISNDLLKLYMGRASYRYRWELKVRFCSIIQLYSELKQLSTLVIQYSNTPNHNDYQWRINILGKGTGEK